MKPNVSCVDSSWASFLDYIKFLFQLVLNSSTQINLNPPLIYFTAVLFFGDETQTLPQRFDFA